MLDTTYGYEIIDGGYRVQKTEARQVRNIIEKVIAGMSNNMIADWLNANHISTRKKRWTMDTYHDFQYGKKQKIFWRTRLSENYK